MTSHTSWPVLQIRDVALTFDGPHATPASTKTAQGGPVFLGISSLKHGRLDLAESGFISEEDYDRWTRRVTPQAGDVVFSYETRLGEVALIPDGLRCALGRRLALMRPKLNVIDPRFLLYAFLGPDFQAVIRKNTVEGSTVPRIMLTDYPRFPIAVPRLVEQQAIAATLGALDDKIESNQRIGTIVPELVAALVSEAVGVDAELVPVSSLARFVNGGAYTKGASGSGRMVIRIAELNSGPGPSTVYNDLDVPADKVARPGDLLMSWSGSLDIYRWARPEAIINQHIFKVMPNALPAWLVHDRLKSVMPTFQAIAKDKATTMGHIQRGHLEATAVPMPSPEAIDRLDEALGPLWERLLHAEQEVLRLASLRNVLLPELLSGRLRVREAIESREGGI
jgi:type I restriction enzyme S subunit